MRPQTGGVQQVLVFFGAAVPVAVGVLVLVRQPRQRIGWLLVAHGVFFASLAFDGTATTHTGLIVDQLTQGWWVFLFLFLVLIAYLLPDGHVANRFWRRWVRMGLAGAVLFVVGAAGDASGFAASHHGARLPVPWLPETLSGFVGVVGLVLVVLLFFGSVIAVWRRLRRAQGDDRLQLLWLVWGALTVPVALLTGWVNHFLLGDGPFFTPALGLVAIALPITVGIAILRHRLFDIQLVLSRTLTYLLLIVAVLAVYALLLFTTDRLIGNRTTGGLLAVGVVAVAVHPAYSTLRRRIDRWVYGLRSDPRTAIRLVADRAEAADPDRLVAAVTDAVAAALRVGRVWVEMTGPEPDAALRTPMVHRGEHVGYLALEVPPGRDLSRADLNLFKDLARYAAILVRSEQLKDELRDSRSRIVAGREEERRRLRRDLHDGLGPSLAAIVLKLSATQSRADAEERNSLVAEARDEVKATITEVRRLVDDLRPPAIDEVGLLDAIRQRASALSSLVTFEVTAPDGLTDRLPALPAAVEVAAFRIASEAMTNVARHSGATRCLVAVELNGSFQLTVSDNGHGTGATTSPGVGWTSMRERAAELGGSCTITSQPHGGLIVRAVLPLTEVQPAAADA
ncbi:sensor histidine kinase [Frankia tisae]|uniref:sensor histidine kinase n=1 Tax=Frankia tisae TaxID=2950104 RepID=UPI0021C1CF3C|nr:histidine kinase [Frankia tisae]